VSEAAIGRHFRLDENCVPLAGAPRVRVYFAQLRRALEGLERGVERETPITNAERRAVSAWVARLRRTLDLLALRHFFPQAGAELRIDASDSGFPHWSALLELGADLERRDAELAALPGPAALKRQMLEQIVRHSLHPSELQARLMRRIYLEALAPEGVVQPFLAGPLEPVGKGGDEASWFWSFATYDRALNRPFLHAIYFAWEGRPPAQGSDELAELGAVAERTAAGRASLLVLAKQLDERLPRLHPRIVKRLVLGPFWAPGFTGREGPLGALLGRLEERWPFALRFESEVLISERETRVGAGWLSKGELRQVFWLSDAVDLAARGVSQLARYLVLPHWLAQQVADAGLLPDHRPIVLDESRP
jgi:hypothetical protein